MTYINSKKLKKTEFSDQLMKTIMRYKRIGYNVDAIERSAYLVVNSMTVNNSAVLFNLHAGESELRLHSSPNIKLNIWLAGAGLLSVSWHIGV